MNDIDREYHEVSNIFPLMDGEEYEQLKSDISRNGLREPIWIDRDGKIIDGRNRHRACLDTGTPEKFRTYDGNGSLVNFVISLNLHRRHLSSSQKAAISLDVLPMLEKEAKERQLAGVTLSNSLDKVDPHKNTASEQAADIFKTNRQYVTDAKSIKEKAPDLFERVKSGELTIPQVKRTLSRADRIESTPVIPDGKFNVIYADPPWKYEFGFDIHGAADRHYHTLSVDELCDLPIPELVENNAVLFLWVTSPKLFDAQKIIKAWGFEYKTSFVWDKVKHVMGHYNSVRHEFLLVCVKGSFPKQSNTLHDSVITIERTDEHSEKPEYFRQLIVDMYPLSKKIELFARKRADGWESWGNEL